MKKHLSFLIKRMRHSLKNYMFHRLAPGAIGVVVETEFGSIICDPRDSHVSRQILKWGRYNPAEAKIYRKVSNGLGSALIVGSHIGALAFQLESCFEDITCVEANPKTYEILKRNIRLRGLEAKMSAANFAACDRSSPISFLCNSENSGGSKISPAFGDVEYLYDSPERIIVEGKRLDDLYFDRKFDFILIDVEGGEMGAIMGGRQIIKRSTVLVVEYVPSHIKRVAKKSISEFAELLLGLRFDVVEFPSLGIKGSPEECLLSSLLEIERMGGYEDGVIFTRLR